MVRVRNLVLAIAAATALTSEMAYALGLGEVTLKSALNQPLVAEIELLDAKSLAPGEVVPVLASQADFNRAGVDRQYFLTDLTFTPVLRPDGKSVIRVSSTKPVREPYLNFLIEVLWPSGRLLREYTLLLDPPLYSPEIAAAVAPQLPISMPAARTGAVSQAQPAPASEVSSGTPGQQRDQYTVTPNDRLWEIADRVRQGGTVHQAMLAIQDLNPNAFIGANINRMKHGQVLRLPTAEQIASRTQAEAIRQVAEQNASWRSGPGAPGTGARQLDATQRGTAGAAPTRTEQGDNLRLVAPDSGTSESGSESGDAEDTKALRDKLALTEESLDSSRRENLDLKDRLNDLQGQLDKLQRLMQLKDDQLASLQAELGVEANSNAATPAANPVNVASGSPEEPAVPGAESDVEANSAPDSAAAAAAPEGQPSVASQRPETQPASTEATPAVAQPDELASDGNDEGVLDNPILLGVLGGSALLLLLVGLMALSRRNAMKEAELQESLLEQERSDTLYVGQHDFQTSELDDPTQDDADAAQGASESLVGAGNDPLAEADIYIAYGRFNQAAELLQNALNDEPQRSDLRLKLMEVYAELGDRDGFARQESELREIGGSTAPIDQLKARYPAMVMVPVAAAASTTYSGNELDTLSLDDLELDGPTSTVPDAPVTDDSFDLGLDDFKFDDDLSGGPNERPEVSSELHEFSFDELSLEAAADEAQADDFAFELDENSKSEGASLDDDFSDFSLDFEESETAAPRSPDPLQDSNSAATTSSVNTDEQTHGLGEPLQTESMPDDFDLSLDDAAINEPVEGKTFSSQLEEVEAQLEGLSREIGEPADRTVDAEPVVAPIDDMGEDFDFFSDTDETTTKLDLARAYIDMGDSEGARDILDEVISEGSDNQQQEAREMLAKLG